MYIPSGGKITLEKSQTLAKSMKKTTITNEVLELCVCSIKMGKFSIKKSNIILTIQDRLPRSERTFQHIRSLAQRYTRTKFTSIIGDKCIPNLPESRVPMIIVYRKGDIRHQIVAWGADKDRQPEGRTLFSTLTTISYIIQYYFRIGGNFTGHRCSRSPREFFWIRWT